MVVVVAATLFHAFALSMRLVQTSDSAQGLVAARAVVDGNLLLSGWHFPIDDYYFTDTIPYAAIAWLEGPRPLLLALVPAIGYALFTLAALLACLRRSGAPARNFEAGAALAFLLAAPVWIGSWNPLLLSDMHCGTAFGAFVSLVLCARMSGNAGRFAGRIGTGAALLVVAAATVASDPFSLVFAFASAIAVLLADSLSNSRTRGALIALAAGMACGLLLPLAIAAAGGFTTENDVLTGVAPPQLFGRNLLALAAGFIRLSGIPSVQPAGLRVDLLLVLRSMALALVVTAVCGTTRRLFRSSAAPLLDRLLCAGILTLLTACVLSGQFARDVTPQTVWSGGSALRFVVPAWLFAAVLTARRMPEMLGALQPPLARAARPLLALLAVLTLLGGGWLSGARSQPLWMGRNASQTAAGWLAGHGLRQGVGEYWSANLIAAMSGGGVEVRSVVPDAGRLVDYVWVEDARWCKRRPQFAIWRENSPTGVTLDEVRATYAVSHVATVAGYRIALLAGVAPPVHFR